MDDLENHEHAEHAAHGGSKKIAMLIAVLAAMLALSEAGGKTANTAAQRHSIEANDQWGYYQAKNSRLSSLAANIELAEALTKDSPPATVAAKDEAARKWREKIAVYEKEKAEISEKAKEVEHERDHALGTLHSYETASALLQLAIVLATASVISGVVLLAAGSAGLGLCGGILAAMAYANPVAAHAVLHFLRLV